MGQKAHPTGLRLGIVKGWKSRYYASKGDWAKFIKQDDQVQKFFKAKNREYGLSSIEIERPADKKLNITLVSSKPGTVTGDNGINVKALELSVAKLLKDRSLEISIEVKEIKDADLSAQLIAEEIAEGIENRVSFRIAQKRAIRRVLMAGAKGIKTQVAGRLNGVDMARTEGYSEGVVPQQTFRNDIDYATAEAMTTYGLIGIKVWISKGDVLNGKNEIERNPRKPMGDRRRPNNRGPRGPRRDAVKPAANKTEAK